MKYNIKLIPPEKLISLAGEGYTYNQAARILKRDCYTIKVHARHHNELIHRQFALNGLERQYNPRGYKKL